MEHILKVKEETSGQHVGVNLLLQTCSKQSGIIKGEKQKVTICVQETEKPDLTPNPVESRISWAKVQDSSAPFGRFF